MGVASCGRGFVVGVVLEMGRGLRGVVAVLVSLMGGTSEAGFCRGRGFRCGRGLRRAGRSSPEGPRQSGFAAGVASSVVGVACMGRGYDVVGVASVTGVASNEELPRWAWPLLESSGRGVVRARLKSPGRRAERRGVVRSTDSHSSANNLGMTVEPQ